MPAILINNAAEVKNDSTKHRSKILQKTSIEQFNMTHMFIHTFKGTRECLGISQYA